MSNHLYLQRIRECVKFKFVLQQLIQQKYLSQRLSFKVQITLSFITISFNLMIVSNWCVKLSFHESKIIVYCTNRNP